MADMNDIVRLAVDVYHGTPEKYSLKEANDTLREALIQANNGSTKMDYRAIRDGKCNGLFAIIEEVLDNTVIEGLTGNEFFMNYVDYRNLALGDKNEFLVDDDLLFQVARVADGTQGIRRQRLESGTEISIATEMHMVRIYEELNRVLSGRVDFNDMIRKVGESYQKDILDQIYALWIASTTPAAVTGGAPMGSAVYFPAAGSYSETAMLDLIDHVEAASGKSATIIGTKKALRNLAESIQADSAKEELHGMGYYGKFFGVPCMALPQRHKVGTTDFLLSNNVLTVVAGDSKPIKFVYEGDPIVIPGDPLDNADLTQEYVYGSKYGLGLVLSGTQSIGAYTISP